MTELQKEFLGAMKGYGLSMNTLLVVGKLIRAEKDIREMCGRIIEAVDAGKEVTDGLVGQILYDMMMEAAPEVTDEEPDEE